MGHALRKKINTIKANANTFLTPVLPTVVVKMPRKEENKNIEVEEVPIEKDPEVHKTQNYHSHGLGYSSRSTNLGDGLTNILSSYRNIPGSKTHLGETL